jgi:hypothetical protein
MVLEGILEAGSENTYNSCAFVKKQESTSMKRTILFFIIRLKRPLEEIILQRPETARKNVYYILMDPLTVERFSWRPLIN